MTLNLCAKCGGSPVEQTRGEMKPEDHHMQFNRHKAAKAFMDDHGVSLPIAGFHDDAHNVEDMGAEHASDVRVSCPQCGNHIGWDRRDTEEFRNHGMADNRRHTIARDGNLDAIRQRWNDANPLKAA